MALKILNGGGVGWVGDEGAVWIQCPHLSQAYSVGALMRRARMLWQCCFGLESPFLWGSMVLPSNYDQYLIMTGLFISFLSFIRMLMKLVDSSR